MLSKVSATGLRVPMEATRVDNKCSFAPSEVLTKTDDVVKYAKQGDTSNDGLDNTRELTRSFIKFVSNTQVMSSMMIGEIRWYIACYS